MGRITDTYVKNQLYSRPNLDISHRCILKCPQCVRQKKISQDQIKRSFDLEIENFYKILNYYDNGITFCGQISDPIYHPKFLDFLKICDGLGRAIRISTNGTGKDDQWWNEAFSYGLNENAWYFGVDGIDEKSEFYRIGSSFKEVWSRMQQGRDLGHTIVWQYIIFEYNENEVSQAIDIAKHENFSLLLIKTNRGFNDNTGFYRKNVSISMGKPSTDNLAERIKGEMWAHVTKELRDWHFLRKIYS